MTATTRDNATPLTDTMKATRVPWQVKFTALTFIWGSSFLLMKVGLRSLAPLQISGLRILSGAGVLLLLLTAVALWDWVASMISRAPYLDWLPRHPLPPWLRPVRSSFIAIAFFYGIVIGHYFWH